MIGCDILEIKRCKELVENKSFLDKYFTEQERKYINSKKDKIQTLAGLYACKEAVLKALKIGIGKGLALIDIEIGHDENGTPIVCINSKITNLLDKICKSKINISISHDGEYALAVCEIE